MTNESFIKVRNTYQNIFSYNIWSTCILHNEKLMIKEWIVTNLNSSAISMLLEELDICLWTNIRLAKGPWEGPKLPLLLLLEFAAPPVGVVLKAPFRAALLELLLLRALWVLKDIMWHSIILIIWFFGHNIGDQLANKIENHFEF